MVGVGMVGVVSHFSFCGVQVTIQRKQDTIVHTAVYTQTHLYTYIYIHTYIYIYIYIYRCIQIYPDEEEDDFHE